MNCAPSGWSNFAYLNVGTDKSRFISWWGIWQTALVKLLEDQSNLFHFQIPMHYGFKLEELDTFKLNSLR
jgi:hypothetical protein